SAGTASAQDPDAWSCVFTAATTPFSSGFGSYNLFTAEFPGVGMLSECAISDPSDPDGPTGVQSMSMNSTGTYQNITCGTGVMSGDATITTTEPITAHYTIAAVNGTGALTIDSI